MHAFSGRGRRTAAKAPRRSRVGWFAEPPPCPRTASPRKRRSGCPFLQAARSSARAGALAELRPGGVPCISGLRLHCESVAQCSMEILCRSMQILRSLTVKPTWLVRETLSPHTGYEQDGRNLPSQTAWHHQSPGCSLVGLDALSKSIV